MRANKYKKPKGGFEIIKAAVLLFQKVKHGGCIKVALFLGIRRHLSFCTF